MANTFAEARLNLRLYLARAILPTMPQSEPPDMFTGRVATPRSQLGWVLPSQPEAFRKLSMVITLPHNVARKVTAWESCPIQNAFFLAHTDRVSLSSYPQVRPAHARGEPPGGGSAKPPGI